MTPGILCPEMTPSSRKNWLLGQTCTGAPGDSLAKPAAPCVWWREACAPLPLSSLGLLTGHAHGKGS